MKGLSSILFEDKIVRARFPPMRNGATFALLLSLFGCRDQVAATYATYADAQRAGAIERGWVPAFVPSSARDITDSHNLDTNRQTLRFTIPSSEVEAMVSGLRVVSVDEKRAAADLSQRHGFGPASKTYVICSKPLNGALTVDRESGRAVYDTTLEWADNDCTPGG